MKKTIVFTIAVIIVCMVNGSCRSKTIKEAREDFTIVYDSARAKIHIYCGTNLFTTFWYSDTLEKPFLYPVYDAAGNRITRGFPIEILPGERTDHPHHVGLWFNYGDVNGFDFWNNSRAIPVGEKSKYGRIVVKGKPGIYSGKDSAALSYSAVWRSEMGKDLLHEFTCYTFTEKDSVRIIKRKTILKPVNESVVFTDNKEGLFAVRVARFLEMPSRETVQLTDSHGKITSVPVADNSGVTGNYIASSGKEGDAVWGTRNQWVTLRGEYKGIKVSVTIFDHPRNPGYPAHFHARGYGLFSVNNLGQQVFNPNETKQVFTLKTGEEIAFKHMIVITSGKWLSTEEAKLFFNGFSQEK